MNHTAASFRWSLIAVAVMLAGLLAWPAASRAQTVAGQARAAQATVQTALLATTTTLSDTGTLAGTNDARDASLLTASVPSLLDAGVFSAATMSFSDQVDSQASLGSLNLTVAGIGITADSVVAQASQVLGAAATGSSAISGLSIGGVPIVLTGAPNQTVAIPGGQVVINEQQVSPSGTITVNGLHVTVSGVADVVIASATAGIQ